MMSSCLGTCSSCIVGCNLPTYVACVMSGTHTIWIMGNICISDRAPDKGTSLYYHSRRSSLGKSGTHLTNASWAHNWNLVKLQITLISILMVQSRYNFAHATTGQLSEHVHNCDMILSIIFNLRIQFFFKKFWFWVHKLFVKWVFGK